MKAIYYVNLALLLIYAVYCLYGLLTINSSGLDAAGRGMSSAYMTFGLIAVIILLLLNLISSTWLRVGILLLGLYPIFSTVVHQLRLNSFDRKVKSGELFGKYFDHEHVKKMATAFAQDDFEKFKELIEEDDSKINVLARNQETLFNLIARSSLGYLEEKNMKYLKLLLKHGADPNASASSPLASTAENTSLEFFKMLLEAGADPNGKDNKGEAVIYKLVRMNGPHDHDKLKLLVRDYKADTNVPFGQQGWMQNFSPLLFATSKREWEEVMLLLDHGADINFDPPSGSDFWVYINNAKRDYEETGETPSSFIDLMDHPLVKGYSVNE